MSTPAPGVSVSAGSGRRPGLPLSAAQPFGAAVALFGLLAVAIDWPWLSGKMTIPWDAKAVFQPQIAFLARALAEGDWPFWAPFVFSGHPQIADPQAMIFSPPFLALALSCGSPGLWAVDCVALLMVWLGGAALMLWFRDRGWHWAGALIAALGFSFGASMAWRIQHFGQVLSLAYLPVALLWLERTLERGSLAYGVALGAAVAAIVMGRDQVALLAVYLLAGLLLWRLSTAPRAARRLIRAGLPLSAAGLCCLLISAIPVVLTALFVSRSVRPSIAYLGAARGSLHPALLLTFLMPDVFGASGRMEDYWGPPSFAWGGTGLFIAQNMGVLYIGMIPLLLALLAGLRGILWAPEIRYFSCAALVALAYALGWYTPFFSIAYRLLPGVDLFRRPADATFLIGALVAILAGYAAHRLFQAPFVRFGRRAVFLAAGVMGIALSATLALALSVGRLQSLPLPLFSAALWGGAGLLALAWAKPRIARTPLAAGAVLAALTAADLAVNNSGSATALAPSLYDVLRPGSANSTIAALKELVVDGDRRRDRVELVGLGFHWPGASLVHGLENTLGYNPLRLSLYSAATGASDNAGLPEERKFSPLFPSYRSTLANLLGLRFIAAGVPIAAIDHQERGRELPLIRRTNEAYIYENPEAFDRVLFATSAESADFARLLGEGVWPPADLKTTVLLEKGDFAAAAVPRRAGQARILSYRNGEVLIAADSPDGGWVVLNDLWHPWWFADVDGKDVEILRANVLFRAVSVAPGRHLIAFRFRPLAGALGELGLN